MKRSLLFAALLLSGIGIESGIGVALADSKDGVFPSAEQVGGQVYVEPIKVGSKFPTDFDVFDAKGDRVDLGKLVAGKKTVLAFFISAAPASVNELRNLQNFVAASSGQIQVLNVNADTVGTALEGGPTKAIAATAKTVQLIQHEQGLTNPMLVAPNDALSPTGLSNRLGFRGLPTIFVLNAQGMVEKVFVGPQQWKRGDIS
jgi:hypothetical protein